MQSTPNDSTEPGLPAIPKQLLDLWESRARQLASNIAQGGREHRELAHAASLIGQDYADRFLIELIQNANDQALLGGEHRSTVVVIRSESLLVVSNGGQVVSARNLERLSSLADSDKSGLLVGNKGVGFKAVYHVTDAPEVYSASQSTDGRSQASIFDSFGIGIALERDPFTHSELRSFVEEQVATFIEDNPGIASTLKARTTDDPLELLRKEYAHVAGFKFPMSRDADALRRRVEECNFPDDLRPQVRTLVVLPLRNARAGELVDSAVERLTGASKGRASEAELGLLFLTGIERIVIIDRVRDRTWSVARTRRTTAGRVERATIETVGPNGDVRRQRYWMLRRDALHCDAATAASRRQIIEAALASFRLEAWHVDDPLPVTVAIPDPGGRQALTLGTSGFFCLGLPTHQETGLPVHVDARFFATIDRKGLEFESEYNGMLLNEAVSLLGELLTALRAVPVLRARRSATLALARSVGALADEVYEAGGIADGDVVLSWDGKSFISRSRCLLPNSKERAVLPHLVSAAASTGRGFDNLPEQGLLTRASQALESMNLPSMTTAPHPWLNSMGAQLSLLECAARANRGQGNQVWEPFICAVLDCFEQPLLEQQVWLPVGNAELASPAEGIFLPAHRDTSADDEEVSIVPPEVASRLRLLDDRALRVRQEGRALTATASRLSTKRIVRSPRKSDLLEIALFPALNAAAGDEEQGSLAMALFVQALVWIRSMKPMSLRSLDLRHAKAPLLDASDAIAWASSSTLYLGVGWGLASTHDDLLGLAYPCRRLVPFDLMCRRYGLPEGDAAVWRASAERLGVQALPVIRTCGEERAAPLVSSGYRLQVSGTPKLGEPMLEEIYALYVRRLAKFTTSWDWQFDHDVAEIRWVDGLESQDRRTHVVDLMLAFPNRYLESARTTLSRDGHGPMHSDVPQMWHFALTDLNWPVFPGERGAGNEPARVTANQLWRVPVGLARRAGYAQQLIVVPNSLVQAGALLQSLGVPSVEDAPLKRLFEALSDLAKRLDPELLHTRNDALSLAKELYACIDERLAKESIDRVPSDVRLPLFQERRLRAVDPNRPETRILFDDDQARAKYVIGAADSPNVPISRDTSIERIHELFVRTWGLGRILRTSSSPIALAFEPSNGESEPLAFLEWLRTAYPQIDVAPELAALLTYGGERTLTSERLTRHWKEFASLKLTFGSFKTFGVSSFYDRSQGMLWLQSDLPSHEVVAATWELVGQRARDLIAAFGRALQEHSSRAFLQARGISDVEIVDVSDAAGLHRSSDIQELSPALLAAKVHLTSSMTLDEAATWLTSVGTRTEHVAAAFDQEGLLQVLRQAIGLQPPEGELAVLRHLGVPIALWQDAILRRDGKKYVFPATVRRFHDVIQHLGAIAKELAVGSASLDLIAVAGSLNLLQNISIPAEVSEMPVDQSGVDRYVLDQALDSVASYGPIARQLTAIQAPPWQVELPLPGDVSRRGVRLFQDIPWQTREIDAATSVRAIIEIAQRLAPDYTEDVDASAVLADNALQSRIEGQWAHVYAALARVRVLIERSAPNVVRALSAAQAFRDSTTLTSLLAKFPGASKPGPKAPEPRISLLGLNLTDSELRNEMSGGGDGAIGQLLVAAAGRPLDPGLLGGARAPLPAAQPNAPGTRKPGAGGGGGAALRRENEIVGDIGEAFVHEWLATRLAEDYGSDCWLSEARARYGLPPAGNDNMGYDFRVPDPAGLLFGYPAKALLIEVKATSTDGRGAFPMSRHEWDEARRCHEAIGTDEVYVVVRVANALVDPRISDFVIDPFDCFRRGEIQLADRDIWVHVAPRIPAASP